MINMKTLQILIAFFFVVILDDGLMKASGNLPLPYFSPDDNTSIEMMRHEIGQSYFFSLCYVIIYSKIC